MGTDINGLGATFKRAWQLLTQNLVILLPTLIGCVPIVIVMLFVTGAGAGVGFSIAALVRPTHPLAPALIVSTLIISIVVCLAALAIVFLISMAQWGTTIAMSSEAWEHGLTTLQNGWNAFRERWRDLVNASLLVFVLALIACILAVPTLFLSFIAVGVLTLYVGPSVIIGKYTGRAAIAQSFHLATRNFWPTVILALAAFGIPVVAAALSSLIGNIVFFVGSIIAFVTPIVATVYMNLVIVGHYRELQKSLPERLPA